MKRLQVQIFLYKSFVDSVLIRFQIFHMAKNYTACHDNVPIKETTAETAGAA
jgi:hypothetical protein